MKTLYFDGFSFHSYRYANITCKVVEGFFRGDCENNDSYDEMTTWNVVKLNENWYLIDTIRGSQTVEMQEEKWLRKNNVNDDREIISTFNEAYFLTNPEEFIFEHFPQDDKYQLLARKVTFMEFKEMAYVRPKFFESKLKTISHPRYIISTVDNLNEIIIGLNENVSVNFSKELSVDEHDPETISDINRYCVMFKDERRNFLIIRLRLPYSSNYNLTLKVKNNTEENPKFVWCLSYRIEFKFSLNLNVEPFPPTIMEELGPNNSDEFCLLQNMKPLLGMMNLTKKFQQISFLGDDKTYKLCASIQKNDENINYSLLKAFENGKGLIKPRALGEYSVNIGLIQKDDDDNCFEPIASFIFNNKIKYFQDWTPKVFEIENIGKQEAFDTFGLETQENFFPYKKCAKDSYEFQFTKSRPCRISTQFKFHKEKSNIEENLDRYSFYENSVDNCKFFIKFPFKGKYSFHVFAKPTEENEKTDDEFKCVYVCFFQAETKYEGNLRYPIPHEFWHEKESHKIIDSLKPNVTNGSIKFEIEGVEAEKMMIFLEDSPKVYDFAKSANSWIADIKPEEFYGKVTIKALFNGQDSNYIELLSYNMEFKSPSRPNSRTSKSEQNGNALDSPSSNDITGDDYESICLSGRSSVASMIEQEGKQGRMNKANKTMELQISKLHYISDFTEQNDNFNYVRFLKNNLNLLTNFFFNYFFQNRTFPSLQMKILIKQPIWL